MEVMEKNKKSVLVVGGGISGIRSALDLALIGFTVTLIDKSPHTGGTLLKLDHQFPNDYCGICRMLPMVERENNEQYCLRRGLSHENIDILCSAQLIFLEGEPGDFTATVEIEPTMVDPERCIGCGECGAVCPVEVPDEFNAGLSKRKAIYLPSPYSHHNQYVVDTKACTRCGECEKICPTQAIDLAGVKDVRKIQAGAVILASGFQPFNPASGKNAYLYGFPNVVTSTEFERLISGTGPTGGRLVRPGDGKIVKNIAWFQCVGSRDFQTDSDFCSSICCMFSIKEAILAKKLSNGHVGATIFYMDMRTFGKNYQQYRDDAEKEYGIRFEKSRVHSVVPDGEGSLKAMYATQNGKTIEETFDLIVLATGQRPSEGTSELSRITGAKLNPWGFFQNEPFSMTRTNREGIFTSGSSTGLQDISDSVITAGSASLAASGYLMNREGDMARAREPVPDFRDVSLEVPLVAVGICSFEGSFEPGELENIKSKAFAMESVSHVFHSIFSNKRDCLNHIRTELAGSPWNRLLLCVCVRQAFDLGELSGILSFSPELIEIIEIGPTSKLIGREQKNRRSRETLAKIAMGIGKLKSTKPTKKQYSEILGNALVVGGGIAGMTAANSIADHGYSVDLVEQSSHLGGNLTQRYRTLDGHSPERLLEKTVAKTENHPKIKVHRNAKVIQSIGDMGEFATTIETNAHTEHIEHGITVLATGGREAQSSSYGYGNSDKIVTQGELERKLHENEIDPLSLTTVAMIQCVDSREPPRNYCSRICCVSALKNALYLLKKNPDLAVVIFYRDLMAYGFAETYFTRARKAGVIFVPYVVEKKPVVTIENGAPIIAAIDPILQRDLNVQADLLVLSTGIVPNITENEAAAFGIEMDKYGFFQEQDPKWRPVDFIEKGVFMCGIAHSPRNITESIAMAEAAAQRGIRFLSMQRLSSGRGAVASVNESLCTGCKTCVDLCAYQAISFHEQTKTAHIDEITCQGCGVCAAACPTACISVHGYTQDQMFAKIEGMLAFE